MSVYHRTLMINKPNMYSGCKINIMITMFGTLVFNMIKQLTIMPNTKLIFL